MADPTQKAPLPHRGGAIARIVAAHRRAAVAQRDRTPVLARAISRALSHAAAPFRTLGLRDRDVATAQDTSLSEVLGDLPRHGLVVVLEGSGPRRGLLVVSGGLIDALVEVQTTGRVETRAQPARSVTRVDEALSRDFIDLLLAAFAREVEDLPQADRPPRMAFGSRIDDRTHLPLLLPEADYDLIRAELSFAEAADRTGTIVLALPAPAGARRTQPPGAPGRAGARPDAEHAPPHPEMEAALRDVAIPLDAVLLRTRRSLAEIEALAPGDLLFFEPSDLSALRLEAAGGRVVLSGRLGQIGGKRAVRVGQGHGARAPSAAALPPAGSPHGAAPARSSDGPAMAFDPDAGDAGGPGPAPMPAPMPTPMPAPMPAPLPMSGLPDDLPWDAEAAPPPAYPTGG